MAHNQNHTIAIERKLHLNASHSMLLCRMINVQHFSFAFNCKLSLGLPQNRVHFDKTENALRQPDNKQINKQTKQAKKKPSTNAKYAVCDV